MIKIKKIIPIMILAFLFSLTYVSALNSTDDVMNYLGLIDAKLNATDITLADINKNTSLTTPLVSSISDDTQQNNWIYIFILCIVGGLLIISYLSSDNILPIFAGILLVILGLFFAQFGIYGLSNDLIEKAILIITIMLGLYFILRSVLSLLSEGGL